MARKTTRKSPRKPAAAPANWIQCVSFEIEVDGPNKAFSMEAKGAGGTDGHVAPRSAQTDLVRDVFKVLGSVWPAPDFEYQVDSSNRITAIRGKGSN